MLLVFVVTVRGPRLTQDERGTGDRVCDDTPNVGQGCDGYNNPPCDSWPFCLVGEAPEESKETPLHSPKAAPEENRGGELAFEIER